MAKGYIYIKAHSTRDAFKAKNELHGQGAFVG